MSSNSSQSSLRLVSAPRGRLIDAVAAFLAAKGAKEPATVTFYELPLRQYRVSVGPDHWPPDAESINRYLAAVRKRGCTVGTVAAYYRALKTWLNWLVRQDLLAPSSNPIGQVEKPPRVRRVPRAPAEEALADLFGALKALARLNQWLAIRDLALLRLALDSGLRISELARLDVADVNLAGGTAWVAASKNHEERTAVFSRGLVVEELRAWLAVRGGLAVKARVGALFVSDERGRLTPSGLRQILRRRLRAAGLNHFNFHALRHAYAIYTLRYGGDLADIQAQLGHKELATTAIYLKAEETGRAGRHARSSPAEHLSGRLTATDQR